MIERIDHIVAVVDDFRAAKKLLLDAGCPLVWDGMAGEHADCAFSIGPVNLELLSPEALSDWPQLAEWQSWTPRRYGIHVVAFDPGDLDETLVTLRRLGLPASDPRNGRLTAPTGAAILAEVAWRNVYVNGLRGLIAGLPSFLCELVEPGPHLGRTAEAGPIQLVELRVGVPDIGTSRAACERLGGQIADAASEGFTAQFGDTTIRFYAGSGLEIVLSADVDRPTREALSVEVPGVRWLER